MPASVRCGLAVSLVSLCAVACTSSGHGDRSEPPDRDSAAFQVLHLDAPRAVHHATELGDGRVLFTGGCTLPGCGGFEEGQATELFDPEDAAFTPGPTMTSPRASGTATLLEDGRVLLTGGYPGEGQPPTSSAEVFDPASDNFARVGSMTQARADQTATLLGDGSVLIAGGFDASGAALTTTEVFDPATGEFAPGLPLSAPRAAQSAVLIGRDVVLIGGTRSGRALRTTDVLADGRWTPGPNLLTPRVKLAAVALSGPDVFVVGGASSTEGRERLSTTEILDVRRGTSRYGPELSEGEYKLDGAVTRLSDGRIAVAGGDKVNIYDPRRNAMMVLDKPSMGTRSFLSATGVGSDSLLVAGGYDPSITPTDQAWLIPVG